MELPTRTARRAATHAARRRDRRACSAQSTCSWPRLLGAPRPWARHLSASDARPPARAGLAARCRRGRRGRRSRRGRSSSLASRRALPSSLPGKPQPHHAAHAAIAHGRSRRPRRAAQPRLRRPRSRWVPRGVSTPGRRSAHRVPVRRDASREARGRGSGLAKASAVQATQWPAVQTSYTSTTRDGWTGTANGRLERHRESLEPPGLGPWWLGLGRALYERQAIGRALRAGAHVSSAQRFLHYWHLSFL